VDDQTIVREMRLGWLQSLDMVGAVFIGIGTIAG